MALREWRHRRPCYVRENDVREVRWCLVVGGVFGSMLEGKCDEGGSRNGGKGELGCLSKNNVKRWRVVGAYVG